MANLSAGAFSNIPNPSIGVEELPLPYKREKTIDVSSLTDREIFENKNKNENKTLHRLNQTLNQVTLKRVAVLVSLFVLIISSLCIPICVENRSQYYLHEEASYNKKTGTVDNQIVEILRMHANLTDEQTVIDYAKNVLGMVEISSPTYLTLDAGDSVFAGFRSFDDEETAIEKLSDFIISVVG